MGSLYRRRVKCLDCPGRRCTRCRGRGKYSLKTWWAKWYVDGRPIRRSCQTTVKREAKPKLTKWEEKATRGEIASPAVDRLRFEDLKQLILADYKTNGKRSLDKVEDRLQHLEKVFAHRRAVSITTPDVQAYIAKRQEEQAANGTINRELAALKRMFNLAIQADLLTRRPWIPMLREENIRQGFIGPIEALAIREALPGDLRPPFDFLYVTGWRKEEALGLRWPNFDLAAGTVRLSPAESKNRDGRVFALPADLLETVRGLWAATLERARRREPGCPPRRAAELYPYVFTRNGKPIRDFRVAWEKAVEKAGCPGLLVHDLCRSAIRNMVRAGIPERVAMAMAGRKTRSVFDRYDIVSEADLAEAAKRLGGANPAATGTVSGTIEAQADAPGREQAG